jgi:hypothetical protein
MGRVAFYPFGIDETPVAFAAFVDAQRSVSPSDQHLHNTCRISPGVEWGVCRADGNITLSFAYYGSKKLKSLSILGLVIPAAMIAVPPAALAQDSGAPLQAPPAATQSVETAPNNPQSPTLAIAPDEGQQAALPERAKFAKFDSLNIQGITTDFPGNYESLTQDYGGWRSWLYDHNLFFKGASVDSITSDVAGGKSPNTPQSFNGQKPSVSSTDYFVTTLKIDGDGDDIGQIDAQVVLNRVNYNPNGPNHIGFQFLQIYQTFLKRRIEVSGGFGTNNTVYVGIFAGGNPILANGVSGTIPVETGLSASTAPEPFLNVLLKGPGGLYSRSGVQRSIAPVGLVSEALNNGIGLNIDQPGGGRALFIEEVGVRRLASATQHQLWIRAGGLDNTTEYKRFDRRGVSTNWSAYLLGDYQVIQPDKGLPFRGLYLGASALIAPGDVNVYTQTFEGRAYALGMIPTRPGDSLTFTVDYNKFSKAGALARQALDLPAQPYQVSVGALYAIHLTRGVYLSPSIAYLQHPVFAGNFGPALNVSTILTLLF